MAIKTYVCESTVLTAAAALLGTAVDALYKRTIVAAAITNTTGAAISVTIYLVPSGGAASAANAIISTRAIAPGETYFCPELINQAVQGGGGVYGLGNGANFRYTAKDVLNT